MTNATRNHASLFTVCTITWGGIQWRAEIDFTNIEPGENEITRCALKCMQEGWEGDLIEIDPSELPEAAQTAIETACLEESFLNHLEGPEYD